MTKLNSSFTASNKCPAKLTESDKALKPTCGEVDSLKGEVVCSSIEKIEAEKKVAEVCEEEEQGMVRFSAALAGYSPVERFNCSLMTEPVNPVDAVIQQLNHCAVNQLQK